MKASTTSIAACLLALSSASLSKPELSPALQSILDNTHRSKAYTYPTSLTQGIQPKGIYSHNDYWHALPLFTAVSVGCTAIETDVHLYNSTLYVGHHTSSLTAERTFTSLYIEPLLYLLEHSNPPSPFLSEPTYNGIYDWEVFQTLYFMIDIKTDGESPESTWKQVVDELKPLRDKKYLSFITSGTDSITYRPITVIGTGAVPHSLIDPETSRDYFYDGDLPVTSTSSPLTSPIASADFLEVFGRVTNPDGKLNSTQRAVLDEHVRDAHAKGIKIRYWQMPWWPIAVRNGVWREFISAGVDFINADDLVAAAGIDDEARYW
ncbi:MAG: hypothetical protein MMC33_003888 [Icmadophila ericetorum]|nr:hypothetical protein [Icmadophila ericetorum]